MTDRKPRGYITGVTDGPSTMALHKLIITIEIVAPRYGMEAKSDMPEWRSAILDWYKSETAIELGQVDENSKTLVDKVSETARKAGLK